MRWGNLADETVTLTGQSISSNVGSVTVTGTAVVDLVGNQFVSNVGSLTITANADCFTFRCFVYRKCWITYN